MSDGVAGADSFADPVDPVEASRIAALESYAILDTPPEAEFDDLTQLAASLFGTPTALVGLIDADRQWFKSSLGIEGRETPRDLTFCTHALSSHEVLVVPDASKDPRFADNPMVTGPPGIRFYAGAPLVTPEGHVLGTLCVLDQRPRVFAHQQRVLLAGLARQVMTQLEYRRQAHVLVQQQYFTDAVLGSIEVGVVACDAGGRLTLFNHAARAWHGLDADAALDPSSFADHYALFEADGTTPLVDERIPLLQALWTADVANQEMVVAPVGIARRRVLCSAKRIYSDDGSTAGAVAAMHDVTDLRAGEAALRESAAFHDSILAATPDIISLTRPETGIVTWTSRGLTEVLGYTAEDLAQFPLGATRALVHPEDQEHMTAINLATLDLADGEVLQARYRVRNSAGEYRWLSRRVTPFSRRADGTVDETLAVSRDVTELVEVENRLSAAALHDGLTGLPNRALLSDRLGQAIRGTARSGSDVAILYCDLDGFKKVNDSAGHARGDTVLMVAADRMKAALRPQDTVARVGGDEFVIVLDPAPGPRRPEDGPGDSESDPRTRALAIAARITAAMAEPIDIAGTEHVVTTSIGITFAGSGDDPEEALRDADSAMYLAKQRGRNRHEIFDPSLREDALERNRVEQVLRAALKAVSAGEAEGDDAARPVISLAYQPIFDLGSRRITGIEALARLTDLQQQAIPPDVFIPIAEETGMIGELGRFVLDTACADLARWHAEHPSRTDVCMSVNLSARQAGLSGLVEQVTAALEATGLTPGCLTMELTESVLLEAARSTTTALRALRDLGVHISIDDFGTGYASLRYLTQLPVTGVKVDKSFTNGLPHDTAKATIVRLVSTLAAELALSCVVEGIETEEQLAALPTGVLGQGYYLDRPMTAAAVSERLAQPDR